VKVVPMINVDGVLGGNYRTSFIGKDNNRLYLQKEEGETKVNKLLIPEIKAIKDLVINHKESLLAFIDIHHHCVKRGSFMYGPCAQAYQDSTKYFEVRVLPKLLGLSTEMFRF
jgi:cytosolic carboxypeptidase protein 2/3